MIWGRRIYRGILMQMRRTRPITRRLRTCIAIWIRDRTRPDPRMITTRRRRMSALAILNLNRRFSRIRMHMLRTRVIRTVFTVLTILRRTRYRRRVWTWGKTQTTRMITTRQRPRVMTRLLWTRRRRAGIILMNSTTKTHFYMQRCLRWRLRGFINSSVSKPPCFSWGM